MGKGKATSREPRPGASEENAVNALKDMPIRVVGEKPKEGYFLFVGIEQGKVSGTTVAVREIEKLKRTDDTHYWMKGKSRYFPIDRCRVMCAACTTRIDRGKRPKIDCEDCARLVVSK